MLLILKTIFFSPLSDITDDGHAVLFIQTEGVGEAGAEDYDDELDGHGEAALVGQFGL